MNEPCYSPSTSPSDRVLHDVHKGHLPSYPDCDPHNGCPHNERTVVDLLECIGRDGRRKQWTKGCSKEGECLWAAVGFGQRRLIVMIRPWGISCLEQARGPVVTHPDPTRHQLTVERLITATGSTFHTSRAIEAVWEMAAGGRRCDGGEEGRTERDEGEPARRRRWRRRRRRQNNGARHGQGCNQAEISFPGSSHQRASSVVDVVLVRHTTRLCSSTHPAITTRTCPSRGAGRAGRAPCLSTDPAGPTNLWGRSTTPTAVCHSLAVCSRHGHGLGFSGLIKGSTSGGEMMPTPTKGAGGGCGLECEPMIRANEHASYEYSVLLRTRPWFQQAHPGPAPPQITHVVVTSDLHPQGGVWSRRAR